MDSISTSCNRHLTMIGMGTKANAMASMAAGCVVKGPGQACHPPSTRRSPRSPCQMVGCTGRVNVEVWGFWLQPEPPRYSCFTQLKASRPSRTCDESHEEEEGTSGSRDLWQLGVRGPLAAADFAAEASHVDLDGRVLVQLVQETLDHLRLFGTQIT